MKINFVLNALDGHSLKRIEEFKNLGYDVVVYGFDRGTTSQIEGIDIDVIGRFPNSMPYIKRINIIYSSLKKLFSKTKSSDDDIWYYFGLQMCLFCYVLNRNKKFIFEESDMSHLNIKYKLVRNTLEWLNVRFINKSLLSVFTSEGFLIYHFGEKTSYPRNTVVMPNKIHSDILKYPILPKNEFNKRKLRFGFVGFIRYQAVFNMAEFITRNFPQHEFHFYGELATSKEKEKFDSLKQRDNVYFHGYFKNPEQLSKVYSNIDVVISTYDVSSINVKYAEPNKLYESIYFRTPIVVSEGTFLASQVKRYHSGWSVNAFDEDSVCKLVEIIEREVENVTENMINIPQSEAVDSCKPLEEKLKILLGV